MTNIVDVSRNYCIILDTLRRRVRRNKLITFYYKGHHYLTDEQIEICLNSSNKSNKNKIIIFQKEQYDILDSFMNVYESKMNL